MSSFFFVENILPPPEDCFSLVEKENIEKEYSQKNIHNSDIYNSYSQDDIPKAEDFLHYNPYNFVQDNEERAGKNVATPLALGHLSSPLFQGNQESSPFFSPYDSHHHSEDHHSLDTLEEAALRFPSVVFQGEFNAKHRQQRHFFPVNRQFPHEEPFYKFTGKEELILHQQKNLSQSLEKKNQPSLKNSQNSNNIPNPKTTHGLSNDFQKIQQHPLYSPFASSLPHGQKVLPPQENYSSSPFSQPEEIFYNPLDVDDLEVQGYKNIVDGVDCLGPRIFQPPIEPKKKEELSPFMNQKSQNFKKKKEPLVKQDKEFYSQEDHSFSKDQPHWEKPKEWIHKVTKSVQEGVDMVEKLLEKPLDKPSYYGHRQRLKDRFLKSPKAVPDYELVELLLFLVYPRQDVKEKAKEFLGKYGGSLQRFIQEESRKGSPSLRFIVQLVKEIAERMLMADTKEGPLLNDSQKVLDYCHVIMGHLPHEQFRIFFLDRLYRLICEEVQQTGTIDQVSLYPREVIKRALEINATSIILIHNHPSGNTNPSQADIDLTNFLKNSLMPFNIILLDHFIVGRKSHFSFRENNLLS